MKETRLRFDVNMNTYNDSFAIGNLYKSSIQSFSLLSFLIIRKCFKKEQKRVVFYESELNGYCSTERVRERVKVKKKTFTINVYLPMSRGHNVL